MKKNYFLLNFVLLTFFAQAQVVNGNFETVKPNLLPSNWGMNFIQPVTMNTNGQTTADNILYTWCVPSMVYASTDAHTGQYAMEISNALNLTQNVVIPGEATVFADASQDSPGWNIGIPVPTGADIERLGFYYKFLPAGNDIAQANMKLFDANGNQIGSTTFDIHATTNNEYEYIYQYIYHPYYITATSMQITFKMAKPGTTPTFGSRLIIDNVITNHSMLGLNENQMNEAFTVYPTLVDNAINIVSSGIEGSVNYKVINLQGKVVKETVTDASNYLYTIDTGDLSSGMYLLQIESASERTVKKFVKK